eukprot:2080016-Pyramimonas_sp.AAC.1
MRLCRETPAVLLYRSHSRGDHSCRSALPIHPWATDQTSWYVVHVWRFEQRVAAPFWKRGEQGEGDE